MKDERFTKLYEMAKKEVLEDILPFWMRYDVDEENGGFYGVVTREGKPVKEGTKCLVLNARLVWTFASAYRIFRDEKYLQLARRAYDYFCEHFLDKEYGGCYFMLDCKGNPVDDKKFVYGQAFAIYALSEYCRATGDTTARDRAVAIRDLLEAHAYDAEHDGYVEILTRDWTYNPKGQGSNINPEGESTRTMNTHLHLIEAYTGLLRVLRTEEQINLTRRHLAIMLDKVYDADIHHFKMFFRDDWSATSPEISYGHDIEGTWLMMETAEVLGDKAAEEKAAPRCLAMAKACLEQAILPDGSMLYEYNPVTRHLNTTAPGGAGRDRRRLPQRLADERRGRVPGRLAQLLRVHRPLRRGPRVRRVVHHARQQRRGPLRLREQDRRLEVPLPQRAHVL